MTPEPSSAPRAPGGTRNRRLSLSAVLVVMVVAALVGVNARKRAPDPGNPATIAQSACIQLQERIDSIAMPAGTPSLVPAAPRSVPPGLVPGDSMAARIAPGRMPPRPFRNLFAPAPRIEPRASAEAPVRTETRPALPKLSGIFIDGGVRQAAIGGKLAGVGESVEGYVVVEIGPDYVVLDRSGTRQKVGLGRKP